MFVKSPLNYTGGKYKILNQLIENFPTNINAFVDLFTGGGCVALNISARTVYMNDILFPVIELYQEFLDKPTDQIVNHIHQRIEEFKLTKENSDGYICFRDYYNNHKNPIDLFTLICYGFNNQIRFNSKGNFNNAFGKNRSSFNSRIKTNLETFVQKIKELTPVLSSVDFESFDYDRLKAGDFVYCDPPYLISTATYNEKHGDSGWNEKDDIRLYKTLDNLNKKGIRFALSNFIEHNNKINLTLKDWIGGYFVKDIKSNYSNSNYHKIKVPDSITREILVTNY